MNETIAVATDGSPASDQAIRWAAREADRSGDRLMIVHAIEIPMPAYALYGLNIGGYQLDAPTLFDSARQLVDNIVAVARREYPDVPIEGFVDRGETGRVVIDLAKGARLLVVGAHRRRATVADVLLGSTARYVIHHAPMSVAVIPPAEAADYRVPERIIAGVDQSEQAARALAWAAEEAIRWHASLEVIHCWEYPYIALGPAAHEAEAQVKWQATKELEQAVDRLRQARPDLAAVRIEPRLVAESAAATLTAESARADMIVVGSRGHGGFFSLLLGSVAQHTAQHATCPVAIVR